MSDLSLLVLCGRSPRHLHVANRLCRAGRVLAIVQEQGGEWNPKKTLKKLRPGNLYRKAWRSKAGRRPAVARSRVSRETTIFARRARVRCRFAQLPSQ